MNLVQASVENPVKVAVGVLLIALYGLVSLVWMPMQLTPEVQTPTITIETTWAGASPQEVEQEIIVEQEEQLKGVEGVAKMDSESADSLGRITLEFLVGTDMEEALLKVNSRLQQVREYPQDADRPVITTANSSDRPIAWFILSARRPSVEKIDSFVSDHPHLEEPLQLVKNAHNVGLAMLRLKLLAKDHPELTELLPPEGLDVSKLKRFAEDEIEARFERVEGVSQSNVIGGLEDELQVIVDPEKLAAREITLSQVREVLRGQNEDTSAGDLWEGKRRIVVRTLGQFREPAQVEEQLLAMRDGAPVYIRDVAEVQLGYKKPVSVVRRFGESSIAINCVRQTNANVIDVMEGLRETMAEIDSDILKPMGLQLIQVYDETEYINSAVNLVVQNIFIGGALTMIVLMLFLHLSVRTLLAIPLIAVSAIASAYLSGWMFLLCLAILLVCSFWFARGALVAGLAIPTSIVGTFLVLGILGRSLNVISLAGMAFAVGMLVDNAVVVLENIYRRHAMGEKPFVAAVRGAKEVWGAVVASTLTTISVFLPVVFVQEEAGQLFRDIALAISAAVGLSLLVSMTLIPAASARLLRRRGIGGSEMPRTKRRLEQPGNGQAIGAEQADMAFSDWDPTAKPKPAPPTTQIRPANRLVRLIQGGGERFVDMIVGVNDWIQEGLGRRILVVAGLVGAAGLLSWIFWPQVEYLPSGDRNLVIGIVLPPPGYNIDQMMNLGEMVETGLRPYWDVDPESPAAEKLDYPVIGDFFFVAAGRQVFMGIRSYDPARTSELVPLVQKVGSQLPGAIAVAKQTSLFEQGLTAGRTIEIEITGPDLNKLVALGGQTMGIVGEILPNAQARPVPSLDLSSPELHIKPMLIQAADMGISSTDLGFSANALIDGAYVGDYYLGGKKIDLTVIGKKKYADTSQRVSALPIATPQGQLVPLSAVATVEYSSGPEQINHRERVRAISIEVSPPTEMPLEEAMTAITENIVIPLRESGQLAGGYQVNLEGTADKLRDTWLDLRFNILLALVITYLLMAALFESWLYPLVIIMSVPLGAVGGILGLNLLNLFVFQALDVLTMLGFVILIGTVVNNPILIVHQSLNHMREDSMLPRQAIVESVRTRIRPIFMTTTTTVLGLLPLVIFPGAGSELYRGLGSVVLGGLVVSTIFTLFLVPTLFSLMLGGKQWISERLPGKHGEELDTLPAASVREKEAVHA